MRPFSSMKSAVWFRPDPWLTDRELVRYITWRLSDCQQGGCSQYLEEFLEEFDFSRESPSVICAVLRTLWADSGNLESWTPAFDRACIALDGLNKRKILHGMTRAGLKNGAPENVGQNLRGLIANLATGQQKE